MDKNLYYMKLKNSENIEKYVIIDVLKKEVVKEFSNDYDLVVSVMNNEDYFDFASDSLEGVSESMKIFNFVLIFLVNFVFF